MSSVNLVWITENIDAQIAHMARVSNPASQARGVGVVKLIDYLVQHKHWSPFEMVNMCVEINTTRDIGRQILRHRSFTFQEFSQRYADVENLPSAEWRSLRMQDKTNRQASVASGDAMLTAWWSDAQRSIYNNAMLLYKKALDTGIAKEVARVLLPEGLTTSRMYMSGTIRSWLHYCDIRMSPETQLEHQLIAEACWELLAKYAPETVSAFERQDHWAVVEEGEP